MADDFATPRFHEVLEKQRRESEGASFALHQADQRGQLAITGTRFRELMQRFGGTDEGDGCDMSAPGSELPVRAMQTVSLWHVHGKK